MELSLSFQLRGIAGRVHVDYLVNDDPERWGYPVLGRTSQTERARGCPVVHARVDYAGEGYAAVMGWIQVVRHRAGASGKPEVLVDVAPQMHAAEAWMPYFAYGVRPTFFDAPATDDERYEFRATTFLTASPDAVLSPIVEALCGFAWGYDMVNSQPRIVPLEAASDTEWSRVRADLDARYPRWTFL